MGVLVFATRVQGVNESGKLAVYGRGHYLADII